MKPKKKPREWWFNEYVGGAVGHPRKSVDEARRAGRKGVAEIVHVREVLPRQKKRVRK